MTRKGTVMVKVEIEVTEIVAYKMVDDYPDLSWLDQNDDEMGEGFEAEAAERLAAYERGDWWMTYVYVEVAGHRSGGIGGIESDSDDDFYEEIIREEASEIAESLGLSSDAFDSLPIRWVGNG